MGVSIRSALVIMLFSFPSVAQERVPSFQDKRLVPDPIPSNICVEVHWTPKSRPWNEGEAIRVRYPPLDAELIGALTRLRDQGKAVLVRCSATKT